MIDQRLRMQMQTLRPELCALKHTFVMITEIQYMWSTQTPKC